MVVTIKMIKICSESLTLSENNIRAVSKRRYISENFEKSKCRSGAQKRR